MKQRECPFIKQKRYTEEQIVGIVKGVETGKGIVEVCREYGVSEATVHRWKKKYGGLDISEVRRLKQLEAENTQLKKIVAQQAMDIDALKGLLAKNSSPPGAFELLNSLGLVDETDLGGDKLYYHHVEKGHHHHLICQRCGRVFDVGEEILDPLKETLLHKCNFLPDIRHMAIFGHCLTCE